jgi:outer membrane receptor protein involved in Fe transport
VDDELAPTNLRLSYFRSLARPSFREFSVVQLFDYQLRSFTFGNPELELTQIDNFDVRIERFFQNQNNISLSGFYKRFENHIELLFTQAGGFTWRNADLSEVYGLELEGRVKLVRNLEWRGNFSWMYSRSDLSAGFNGQEKYSTRMFGQAPWLVNAMLSYAADSSGFTASVAYNVQGPSWPSPIPRSIPRAHEPMKCLGTCWISPLERNWVSTGALPRGPGIS